MDITKKLKQIEEHFRNITNEELEEKLINAGLGTINPSSNLEMRMITEEELLGENNSYTYLRSRKNYYHFENLPHTAYPRVEVA